MTTDTVRLYISPFSPDLHDRLIPPSLQALVTNVSFHTIQTFPDKGFGYVELPQLDAQKLRTKLNGMTLKGHKIRVEQAKPEFLPRGDAEVMPEKSKGSRKEKKAREQGVMQGFELDGDRRVKRGWTDAGLEDGRRTKKSKQLRGSKQDYSDPPATRRLEFKTKLPANVPSPSATEKRGQKDRGKKREKKQKEDRYVVKEFAKSHKVGGTDVKVRTGQRTLQYEGGKGWIDENGNIVEAEATSRRPQGSKAVEVQQTSIPAESHDTPVRDADSTSTSSDADTASVSESSDESAPAESNESAEAQIVHANGDPATQKEIHPLEALFKRPAPSSSDIDKRMPPPIDTSFSFFASDVVEDDQLVEGGPVGIPQTPHTKRDLEWRGIRSAAPTPDTAAIGGRFRPGFDQDDSARESDAEDVAPVYDAGPQKRRDLGQGDENSKPEESPFRKWFYENRGDLNRGWKKRRREEKKVKRKRENQRLNRKIA